MSSKELASAELSCATPGVEIVRLDRLKPYAGNARTHSRKQIKKIAASIEKFGFVNPIIVDELGQILAGHGRAAAAQSLGWKEAPVLRIEHLSAAEKRAYILADNRLAEDAGWDKEMLAIELQGLIDSDFDLELTGFTMAEVDLVLDGEAEKNAPDGDIADQIPARSMKSQAVSCRGDLWRLGNHLLLCGDATDATAYQKLLGTTRAMLVFTDPPYNVRIEGNVSGLGQHKHREFAMASGEMSPADFKEFLARAFAQMVSHSMDGSIHFICMDWRHMGETLAAGETVYAELKNLCVWVKSNAGMGTFYRSRHELIFAFKNGAAAHVNNFELGQFGRSRTNVWEYAGANAFGGSRDTDLAMHPTVKPVALIAEAIKDCSKRGQIVLDPFGGSGSTLIAAEKAGRRARLIEIDPAYCDVIIRRWQAYTGKRAFHADLGVTFEDVEHVRLAEGEERKGSDRGASRSETSTAE